MAYKCILLLEILLLSILIVPIRSYKHDNVMVGGWFPIVNLNDPEIVKAAKFALKKHNKMAHTKLHLLRLISGEMQIVQGSNLKLVIEANDGLPVAPGIYKAFIFARPSKRNHFVLKSFETVHV
ncbi:hypothetical protein ABFS83_09G026500 [Erythranthe nasuta]